MEEATHQAPLVVEALIVLAAAVVAVPLFKRLGLGSVLGYLAAGLLLGPSALGLFQEPEKLMHFAELGIVFLLFLIGLEINLGRLWSMRRDIFALGSAQILLCGAALALYPLFALGLGPGAALVAGLGLALSSTAIVMQVLEERGEMRTVHGRRSFAILLMQDLAIVPLLAFVVFLAPGGDGDGTPVWLSVAGIVAAVAAVVAAGRWLLNPLFGLLARSGAREIMTAAALLVVIAAGVLMTLVGMSMAMGAFLAGVLLAESNYRHELEADVEPFRGLLLGLFFISVGMSVDLALIAERWAAILAGVAILTAVKVAVVYALVRLFGNGHDVSVRSALLLAQGGEFGFVLFSAAAAAGVMSRADAGLLVATVTASMVLTPALIALGPWLASRQAQAEPDEDFSDARGSVLIIGFGRFGQLVSQMFLAAGHALVVIDSDVQRVEEARRFGARIFYGDGTRLDVLRAARAGQVGLVAVCTAGTEATDRIVEVLREGFPGVPLFVRSYDRRHSIALLERNVDFELRETLESALVFGREGLVRLGADRDEAAEIEREVRSL
ncbi:monovalent cation:proton antiporter-2 (CPA2) family protein, partial [Arenibaculum sp.]|uniref:monovalent cation:proton antiporter-2 (CPA2) family protein n=1 Tax=Arenibaculum sp. TaxID=2865862 RepID=UPI002E116CA9|nr:monovalent cation:proton antiporter-2 (CPA2) family protein [Arenibaculum sp.]